MVRTSNARQDAVEAAVRLFRTQGYSATGLTQLLEESGAPKGSFYFHFPGGKEQLALEALQVFGSELRSRIQRRAAATATGDEPAFIRALFEATARELEASDYTAGCVASNLGGELSSGNRTIADAVNAAVQSWVEAIADGVANRFETRAAATTYAATIMASLSGMRTMARAQRSTAMFAAIADVLVSSLPSTPGNKSGSDTN
ncbi:MAG: TetR/AcrR family transcriptional regulator [Nevskia sp.]|nr:TetR/AcrR family transcriptional regulator [Nevskia sp.]